MTTTGAATGRPVSFDVWSSGGKSGVGTAYTYDQAAGDLPAPSRVWFTLTGGAITDLLYPTVGRANARELSLLVAGPQGVRREADQQNPLPVSVEYLDLQALAYRLTTKDPGGAWQATKDVVTDPAADSLITRWTFTSADAAHGAYAYFVPHLGGSGAGDQLAVRDGAVVAWDERAGVYAVLLADPPPARASVGFLLTSDGLKDLQDGRLDWTFDHLPRPNYGAATLALLTGQPTTLVVGFGNSEAAARAAAQATLGRGFDAVAQDYIAGWRRYLSGLKAPASPDPLYWVSAMVLKAHEDKTYHGAGVASLSFPGGIASRTTTRMSRAIAMCGRATCITSPRPSSPWATLRARGRRWPTSTRYCRKMTGASRKTLFWTARTAGDRSRWMKWPTRFCWPGRWGQRAATKV